MTCALYRHFDAECVLLYVGITTNVVGRQSQHMKGAAWASQIASVSIAHFESEAAAREAEIAAILTEGPVYNVRRSSPRAAVEVDALWRARLLAAVEASGMSKRALSLAAGAGTGYVHSILVEGKDPTIGKLAAICAVLELSLDDLVRGRT